MPAELICEDDTGRGEALLCAACRLFITSELEETKVQGAVNHSFTNPHGLFFDIACYKNAPGCISSNESSTEFTWFRGFSWKVAVCRKCMTHLGWFFTSSSGGFYGLISDRLVSARPEES